MVFIDDEKSLVGSRPVELYLFHLRNTYWPQTSGPDEIIYSGRTWNPTLITRSTKSISTNSLRSKVVLETSLSNEFVTQFITAAPDGIIEFTLYRGQYGDYVPYWQGYVESVNFHPNLAEITCTPMTSRLRRNGLLRKFSRSCPLTLYGSRCLLSLVVYQVLGTVDSSSGFTITSTTFGTKADGYFAGGYIETASYSRMIVSHTGNVIILNAAIPSLADNAPFLAYRGCDHSLTTCTTLTNNLNFGGHPWLPHKNPFVGDPII